MKHMSLQRADRQEFSFPRANPKMQPVCRPTRADQLQPKTKEAERKKKARLRMPIPRHGGYASTAFVKRRRIEKVPHIVKLRGEVGAVGQSTLSIRIHTLNAQNSSNTCIVGYPLSLANFSYRISQGTIYRWYDVQNTQNF